MKKRKRVKNKMRHKPPRLLTNHPMIRKAQRLPSGPGPVRAGEMKQESSPSTATAKHILFVDDDAMVARMGERTLSGLGYKVTAITNSSEALEAFKENPFRFDVVVTDQTMPEMSGVGLAEKLLAIRPEIPIVLTSGYSDDIEQQIGRAVGIRGYAAKPFQIRSLAEIIESLVRP